MLIGLDRLAFHLTIEVRSTYILFRRSQSSPVVQFRNKLRRRMQWSTTSNVFWVSRVARIKSLCTFLDRIYSERISAASTDEDPVVKTFCRSDCVFSRLSLCLLLRRFVFLQFLKIGFICPLLSTKGTRFLLKMKFTRFIK